MRAVPILVTAALVFACGGAEPPVPRNLVVVLVDTLRADHLGVYGYARDTSPRIDAFAEGAVFFVSARSQAPCTFPSVNSLLTSRDPIHFHGRRGGDLGIPEDLPSLPEILKARGFATAAVSESPIVRATPSAHNSAGGFGRGFDSFDESCFARDFHFDAACVNERGLELLAAVAEPFFLYLHYMQPHGRYAPPPSHARRFVRPYTGSLPSVAAGDPNPITSLVADGYLARVREQDVRHLVDLYDDEIAYFDRRFGEFLDGLASLGLAERTIVVLLSDHGEDFLEHGEMKHCRSVYDTQVKTPLVISVPGLGARRPRVDAMNLDVVPTVLDLLGVDPTPFGFEGRSLRGAIEGETSPDPAGAFSSWRAWRSLVFDGDKVAVHLGTGEARLYRLGEDPREQHDLSAAQPEVLDRLRPRLRARILALEGDRASRVEVQDEIVNQLRELGYLE